MCLENLLASCRLDCSIIRSLNSFCFASNDFTPAAVMSASAGARHSGVDVVKARRTFVLLAELERFAKRWTNMLMVLRNESVGYGGGLGLDEAGVGDGLEL